MKLGSLTMVCYSYSFKLDYPKRANLERKKYIENYGYLKFDSSQQSSFSVKLDENAK